MTNRILALAPLVLASACGSDAVSYSEPVTVNLHVKSADVANAAVSDDKNINTESGNPYAVFVTDARAKLGGNDPGSIDVDKVTLLLGATSTGVAALDEIFAGEVDLLFVMNDSNTSAPVASRTIAAGAGAGPLAFDVGFDRHGLAAADYTRLVAGGFKVAIRGPAATMFQSKGADADLQATFTFTAFE